MLECDLELHRLAFTLNLKWENVACVGMRADQICEIDLAVKWIDIVAIFVDLVIPDRFHDVANLYSGFLGWHVRLDARYINAAFTGLAREFAQLWVLGWEKRKPDPWKSAIILALGFFQKMRNDRRRDRVDEL